MDRSAYQHCTLCPRQCGVDRRGGATGFCGMGDGIRAARAALHFWEEPALCGTGGAGAVFFSGCTLHCKYCQNYEISRDGCGIPVSSGRLREIFESLIEQGASCIDLVTPTHFLPDILPALTPKLPVPVVYNCGGYERVETLRELEGLVDVYLPDFKYSDAALSNKISGAADYPAVAAAAIREMLRQTGSFFLEDGLLKRGVLIRHLILPGEIDNSLGVIDWIADELPKHSVMVSLMSQYVPMGEAERLPPYDRRITRQEYDAVLSWMYFRGLTDGYQQGFEAASLDFVPEFDGTGL